MGLAVGPMGALLACKSVEEPVLPVLPPGRPIALIDVDRDILLMADDGSFTSTRDPVPAYRQSMVLMGDSALLALALEPTPPAKLLMLRLPGGDLTRLVSTADLLSEWMGCPVDAKWPQEAAIAGAPPRVVLAGVRVCDTLGLMGLSWPQARVTGVIRDLAVVYWGLAAVPGPSALVAAGGYRPSRPEDGSRVFIVDASSMTVVDSSPPVIPNAPGGWVQVAWTDNPDEGYVLTADAVVRFYRRSTNTILPVAANAVWSRLRFDPRRNAVIVFTPGDGFDWPGRPFLQWFSDTGEVLPRVDLTGMMPDGSNPFVRDARADDSGRLLVLTGTEPMGPLYGFQKCRVWRVNDTASAGVSISPLGAADVYGCRTLLSIGRR